MIYVSSDLHGYPLDKFKALLDKAGFGKDDFLYIIGDVIDRGDGGVDILEWLIRQRNTQLILGNHEDMLLGCDFIFEGTTEDSLYNLKGSQLNNLSVWKNNGANPTITALTNLSHRRRDNILSYLRRCPLYATVKAGGRDYLLVHGGLGDFEEEKAADDYFPRDLLWTRPSLDTEYSHRFTTVTGHTPTHFYGSGYKGRLLRTETWINIDTGAAAGGSPMLLRLDDLAEFYAD